MVPINTTKIRPTKTSGADLGQEPLIHRVRGFDVCIEPNPCFGVYFSQSLGIGQRPNLVGEPNDLEPIVVRVVLVPRHERGTVFIQIEIYPGNQRVVYPRLLPLVVNPKRGRPVLDVGFQKPLAVLFIAGRRKGGNAGKIHLSLNSGPSTSPMRLM